MSRPRNEQGGYWPMAWLARLCAFASTMPANPRLVALVLIEHTNNKALAWPSYATIARETGICERAIPRALATLEADETSIFEGWRKGQRIHAQFRVLHTRRDRHGIKGQASHLYTLALTPVSSARNSTGDARQPVAPDATDLTQGTGPMEGTQLPEERESTLGPGLRADAGGAAGPGQPERPCSTDGQTSWSATAEPGRGVTCWPAEQWCATRCASAASRAKRIERLGKKGKRGR